MFAVLNYVQEDSFFQLSSLSIKSKKTRVYNFIYVAHLTVLYYCKILNIETSKL